MFHGVPGVPRAKMERFTCVNFRKCADSFFNLYNNYNLLQPLQQLQLTSTFTTLTNYFNLYNNYNLLQLLQHPQPNKNPPFFHL